MTYRGLKAEAQDQDDLKQKFGEGIHISLEKLLMIIKW